MLFGPRLGEGHKAREKMVGHHGPAERRPTLIVAGVVGSNEGKSGTPSEVSKQYR